MKRQPREMRRGEAAVVVGCEGIAKHPHPSPTSLNPRRIEQKLPGQRSQRWRCERLSLKTWEKRKEAAALGCEAAASAGNLRDFWRQSRWGKEPSLPRLLRALRSWGGGGERRCWNGGREGGNLKHCSAHLCMAGPKSNNWHVYYSMFRSRLWRKTGWGIKTKPRGDVGGKLRDFTGCAHSHTHIQKAREHNDHQRQADYCGKKAHHRKTFSVLCTRTHARTAWYRQGRRIILWKCVFHGEI